MNKQSPITIKLKYTSEYDFIELRKEYSDAVRLCYNRLSDGFSDKDLRLLFKEEYNLPLLKSFHVANAITEAKGLVKRFEAKKIVFGSKRKLKELNKGLITKEEWSSNRLRSFNICGEKRQRGNRNFVLSIENDKVVFKYDRNNHYDLNIVGLGKNQRSYLTKLQQDCLLKKDSFAISVDEKYIRITFTPKRKKIVLKRDRYIGIDLNPENIGISVLDGNRILHTQEFNFSTLVQNFRDAKVATDSKEAKYMNNKLEYELLEISNMIAKLQRYYHCKFVFVEDLNFKQKDTGLGKRFNRVTKNLWKRNKFIQNLTKHVEIAGGNVFQINPAYTSYIGNLCYNYTDCINSSLEIARRGYNVIILKNKKFYPELTIASLKNQWKEDLTEDVSSWIGLCKKIKNSKLRYRVSLDETLCSSKYNLKSLKSFIDIYIFNRKSIDLNRYIVA